MSTAYDVKKYAPTYLPDGLHPVITTRRRVCIQSDRFMVRPQLEDFLVHSLTGNSIPQVHVPMWEIGVLGTLCR